MRMGCTEPRARQSFAFNHIPPDRGSRSSSAATVPVEKVKALVNFDVPPGDHRRPTIETFATAEEMMAAVAARRGKGGF